MTANEVQHYIQWLEQTFLNTDKVSEDLNLLFQKLSGYISARWKAA